MLNLLRKHFVSRQLAPFERADLRASALADLALDPLQNVVLADEGALPGALNCWLDQRISREFRERFTEQLESHNDTLPFEQEKFIEILASAQNPSEKLSALLSNAGERSHKLFTQLIQDGVALAVGGYDDFELAKRCNALVLSRILERIDAETTFFQCQRHLGGAKPLIDEYRGNGASAFVGPQEGSSSLGVYEPRIDSLKVFSHLSDPSLVGFLLLRKEGLPKELSTFYHELQHQFEDRIGSNFGAIKRTRRLIGTGAVIASATALGAMVGQYFTSIAEQSHPFLMGLAACVATFVVMHEWIRIALRRLPQQVDASLREAFPRFAEHLSSVSSGRTTGSLMSHVRQMTGEAYQYAPTDPARILYALQTMEKLYLLGASMKDIAELIVKDTFNIFSRKYPKLDAALEAKFQEWGDLNAEQRNALVQYLRNDKIAERKLAASNARQIVLEELRAGTAPSL